MIPRTPLARPTKGLLRSQCFRKPNNRRTLASQKSGGFNYETGEINGVKFASRALPGATIQLAVVARAGTRFQLYPGFAEGLEKFAFKVWLCLLRTHSTGLIYSPAHRLPRSGPLFGSQERQSC